MVFFELRNALIRDNIQGLQFATYSKASGEITFHSSPPQIVTIPNLESLFTMPSPTHYEYIIGVTADFTIVLLEVTDVPSISILGQHKLPLPYTPKFILPVDPMAWGYAGDWNDHDTLLSISEEGEICFWALGVKSNEGWICTRKVRTGKTGFRKVRCSSAKKTALSKFSFVQIFRVDTHTS